MWSGVKPGLIPAFFVIWANLRSENHLTAILSAPILKTSSDRDFVITLYGGQVRPFGEEANLMGEPLYVSAPLLPYISRSQVPDRRKAIGRDNYYIICGGFKMTTGDLIQTLSRWGFEINQVWLRRLVYLGVARKPDKRQQGGRGKVADRPADNLYDIATALFLRQHRGIKLEDSAWARKHMAELWGDDWTSDKKSLSGELVMAMAVDNSAGGQKQFASLASDRLVGPAVVEQESYRLAWILREYLLVRICYKNGYQPGHPGLRIVWYEHPGQGVEPRIAIPLDVPELP